MQPFEEHHLGTDNGDARSAQALNRQSAALRRAGGCRIRNQKDLETQLQAALNEVEEQLSAARRTYNAAAMKYNNGVQLFPSSIIAGIVGFRPKSYLDAVGAERDNVDVKNLFRR